MSLSVGFLTASDESAWDAYVARHPLASPFHLAAWKHAIEQTFGYRPLYLFASDSSRGMAGVLPLFLVDTVLTGRVLISTPFAVYGGILAESPEAHAALVAELRRLAESLRVQYVELRNAFPEQCAGFSPVDRYVTFTQPVSPMSDDELLATVHKKTRNMVRKALKSPYSWRPAPSLDHFYRLLANNYRRLGTPVFPRSFFERLLAGFGPLADVREILLEDRVAAVAFNFLFAGSMHTYYAASDPGCLAQAPNNYMYFEFLRWAGHNRFHVFDFGRSKKGTGTFEFKRHWGTTLRELPYEILLVTRKRLPNFSPQNPKFELAIRAWRRLPLPVANALGPRLVRLFP